MPVSPIFARTREKKVLHALVFGDCHRQVRTIPFISIFLSRIERIPVAQTG
jgi:hypothetical protein